MRLTDLRDPGRRVRFMGESIQFVRAALAGQSHASPRIVRSSGMMITTRPTRPTRPTRTTGTAGCGRDHLGDKYAGGSDGHSVER